MEVCAWNEVDLQRFMNLPVLPRKRGNRAGNNVQYLRDYATFDIETSKIQVDGEWQSFCYVWMFYVRRFDLMVTGRTISDFFMFVRDLKYFLNATLVVYVHNLSYEFQFLAGVYDFSPDDVFAVKSRKVCKCMMLGRFEFRCSAILSNMSLEVYTDKYKVKHRKLSGEAFDYSKIRYPWTPLTPLEWEYCYNDVIGLAECIAEELKLGYTLSSIPLTSTGFVRKDLKTAMRAVSHTRIPSIQPDYGVYLMLRAAFRGGDVHANRYYADTILEDVHSYDRSSSYPDVLCNCAFPMSKWQLIDDLTDEGIEKLQSKKRALLLTIEIRHCSLKNPRWPSPYLSASKCDILEELGEERALYDNGRVLSAPYLRTTITDIDFCIIREQYAGDFSIVEGYSARYGRLPDPYIDCVKLYYHRKTVLKNDEAAVVYYEKSKNKLNSCYGCAAQDPVKLNELFLNGEWFRSDADEVPDELKQLPEALYAEYCEKSWSLYSWGVWCTAWARLRLYEGVKLASMQCPDRDAIREDAKSDFIYSDTDSVKYLGYVDWTAYNQQRQDDSLRSGAYADDANGKRYYMGVYEHDADYDEFLTGGAKKYLYRKDGKIGVTISGVNKKRAPAEVEAAGGLEALAGKTFCFTDAGGTKLVYNDKPFYTTLEIDGHTLDITRNVVILDNTYHYGLTEEYYALISMCTMEFEM